LCAGWPPISTRQVEGIDHVVDTLQNGGAVTDALYVPPAPSSVHDANENGAVGANGIPSVSLLLSTNSTNLFSYAMPWGGSVLCGQAVSAGGYGRTCTYQRADGGWGVIGAGGFRGIDAGGNLVESGVIDPNNFDDFSEGTINVLRAAGELAAGAGYANVAEKYDSPFPSKKEWAEWEKKRAKERAADAKYDAWAAQNPGAAINAGNPVAYANPAVPVTVSTYGKIPPGPGVSLPGIGTVLEFVYNFLDGCIVGAPAGASLAGGATFVVAGPILVPPMTAVGSVVGCVGLGLGQATGVVTHQPVLG
jgi:hypothetical protein